MRILDRYIGQHVIVTIAIVTVALLGVDLFFYFVNELRSVGHGDYSLLNAVIFVSLITPRKLYIIFPWAALLGSLLALGGLAKHSELVAMRAAAISVPRIAWSAIKAGLLLTAFMFICGEVVSPYTEAIAQNKKSKALSGYNANMPKGTWIRHNDDFIYVGDTENGLHLQNVTRYSFDPNMQLQEIEHSALADRNNDEWLLQDVKNTSFSNDGLYANNTKDKTTHELLDDEVLQTARVKHLECLTILKLWRVIKTRVAQDLNALEYQKAFWLKLMQPVAAIVMIFLAVPFAFGPLRTSSMGYKLVIGIFVGFGFHTLNSIFGPLTSVAGLSPMLAAILPATIFFVIGYFMVLRIR